MVEYASPAKSSSSGRRIMSARAQGRPQWRWKMADEADRCGCLPLCRRLRGNNPHRTGYALTTTIEVISPTSIPTRRRAPHAHHDFSDLRDWRNKIMKGIGERDSTPPLHRNNCARAKSKEAPPKSTASQALTLFQVETKNRLRVVDPMKETCPLTRDASPPGSLELF
jgi:hypothetical protein